MKLHYVTDAMTGNKVAINVDHVIAVFTVPEGEHKGKTNINLNGGQILVEETDYDIVAILNS
jgi:hypothetical protein